jgi:hypothetical protein
VLATVLAICRDSTRLWHWKGARCQLSAPDRLAGAQPDASFARAKRKSAEPAPRRSVLVRSERLDGPCSDARSESSRLGRVDAHFDVALASYAPPTPRTAG